MRSPDSLAGRIQVIQLLPLSVVEIEHHSAPSALFDHLFLGEDITAYRVPVETRAQLMARIIRGGYPDYYHLPSPARFKLIKGYAHQLLSKDIRDIINLQKPHIFAAILQEVAAHSGMLLKVSRLGSAMKVTNKTMEQWVGLLEELFLVRRLRAAKIAEY